MTAADRLFYYYGYPPFVKVLEYYEEMEDFDVCASLYDTLKRVNERFDFQFSTKWNENTVKDFLEKTDLIKDKDGYLMRFEGYLEQALEFANDHRPNLILNI